MIVTAGAGAAAAVLAATDPEREEDEEAVAPFSPGVSPSAMTVTAGAGGDPAAGEDAALPIGETWGLEVGFAPGG
jgi:hypothetical protein